MRNVYIFITAMTQLCSMASVVGQPAGTITVCGRWEGYRVPDIAQANQSLPNVVVYEKHLRPDYMNHHIRYELTIKRDSFHAVIPIMKERQYVRFSGFGGSAKGYPEDNNTLSAFYLVSPGDSIHIHRPPERGIVLSGGSPMLDYQFRVYSSLRPAGSGIRLGEVASSLVAKRNRISVDFARVEHIANDSGFHMDPFLDALLRLNFESEILSSVYSRLYADILYGKLDTVNGKSIEEFDCYLPACNVVLDERLIVGSTKYLEFLFYMHSAKGTIRARQAGFPTSNRLELANHVYRSILEIEHVFTRERVLDVFFKWSVDIRLLGGEATGLLKEAKSAAIGDELKLVLQNRLNGLSGGESVPEALFEDLEGQQVSLQDFNGKLIVAHFWFLGCSACATMTENMRVAFDKYKEEPGIVFLNINVDSRKDRWLKGLLSSIYSSDYEIALHTGSIGMSHPLLRHYDYIGMPSLLIIDSEGRLVSARPPFGSTAESYADLVELIDSELEAK